MRYLHDNDYQVVALRDLERWVDADSLPEEPWKFIDTRSCGVGRARGPGVRMVTSHATRTAGTMLD